MRILITGICGFVGSTLARALIASNPGYKIIGLDNFIRPGSESNRQELKRLGVTLFHGDLRNASDLETLPAVEWVVDAAANPSVLAGIDGKTSSRQLIEHNLAGTVNMLEYCKAHQAGFILLSTSRVYAIEPLAGLQVTPHQDAFVPTSENLPAGLTVRGVDEGFSTLAPISLYGATKLTSEALALEYGEAFRLPVFINRCGVLAGAGQFGRPDQGIFSYWINTWQHRRPLKYLGFGGHGYQTRDCLHPRDLVSLLEKQFSAPALRVSDRIINVSGGAASGMSLKQLSDWCADRFGPHEVIKDGTLRAFDIPWIILDHAKATALWKWQPTLSTGAILEEIALHAEKHPDWLDLSAAF